MQYSRRMALPGTRGLPRHLHRRPHPDRLYLAGSPGRAPGAAGQPELAIDVDTATAEQKYKDTLPYFNIVSASSPIYLVAGNHEQQEAWHLLAPLAGSLSVMGKNAEKKSYLNPVPDTFYSGDTDTYAYLSGDQLKQDCYAWTWGGALFVVISPFWSIGFTAA